MPDRDLDVVYAGHLCLDIRRETLELPTEGV